MSQNKKVKSGLEREEEYRRINADLGAKTAALVKEADKLLNKNVNDTPLLDQVDRFEEEQNEEDYFEEERCENVPSNDFQRDIQSKINAIAKNIKVDNEKIDIVSREMVEDQSDLESDNLGYEVQNRYLKAKLRVLQEDNEKLAKDLVKKQEDVSNLNGRVKEIEDERNRLYKTSTSQAIQLEKTKKISDDYKSKLEIVESEMLAVKKELEQCKRSLDQQGSSSKSNEVRLNRALDEAAKLKTQLAQTKTSQNDASEAYKKKIEQLLADSRRLERQKSELIQAFKKQMQLIDVLKKQKMQIEVAKMLQFSEEEFIKALDWEK